MSPKQIDDITKAVRIVCDTFGVTYKAMRGEDRHSGIARARGVLAILLVDDLGCTYRDAEKILDKERMWLSHVRSYYLRRAGKDPEYAAKFVACREAL